ncbi:MAG: ribonuclease H-like domain-containing protein [Patescibacteria group bacterium]|mgnify:CR=1 FL=1
MNTIVFDIETIPQDFDALDSLSQAYLLKSAETAEEQKIAKDQMALWAPTNEIVAIGMLSVESENGAVYFQHRGKKFEESIDRGIKYVAGETEKEILERFWQAIRYADKFVTFNGRGFDCPTILLRSAIREVKPTKNLMPYRYSVDAHIDLLEQLTFYNAGRKFNLHMYCQAFGIQSPKGDMNGSDVKPMFEKGEYEKIARYCAGDLFATRELYLRWKEYLQV